jgi:hypothetical protein
MRGAAPADVVSLRSMRYKVRAPDEDAFQTLLAKLSGDAGVEVFTASPRRRVIGTGDLPEPARATIREQGGEITEDVQYDLELP